MKNMVWIVIITLGVLGLAQGEAIKAPEGGAGETSPKSGQSGVARTEAGESPGGEAPGGYAGGVSGSEFAERAELPVAGTPGVSGEGFSQPAKRGTNAPTSWPMGFGGYAAQPGERTISGGRFKLRCLGSGTEYGPFEMRDGAIVDIGATKFRVDILEKTKEQVKLEEKLREKTLSFSVQDAKLMEVVDLLSKQGDVNIVVKESVRREFDPQITIGLKNVPLYDAIRYVTEVTDLRFRIDDHAVFISESEAGAENAPRR